MHEDIMFVFFIMPEEALCFWLKLSASVCLYLAMCLSVCHCIRSKMDQPTNMVSSEVDTLYKNMQYGGAVVPQGSRSAL